MRHGLYVSPRVWAWRQGRVRTIGESVDLVLCLLPFESAFYDAHHVRAVVVGHPLADGIPPIRIRSRRALRSGCRLARRSSPCCRGAVGARSASSAPLRPDDGVAARCPSGIEFVAPMANAGARAVFELALARACARRQRAPGRRPSPGCGDRSRRGARRVGHRNPRDGAREAADGCRVPCGRRSLAGCCARWAW